MNGQEFNENDLEHVMAGNSYGMAQNEALNHAGMYRVTSIEKLNKQDDLTAAFDTRQTNMEELEYLRANTRLGPIAALKLANAKSINMNLATELEYELRTRAWERIWEKTWKQYGDGQSLSEFAYDSLRQQLDNNYGAPRR